MKKYLLKLFIFLWLFLFISACSADKKYDKKKAINLLVNNSSVSFSGEKVLLPQSINKESFTYSQANGFKHLTKKYHLKTQSFFGLMPKQFYEFSKQIIYQQFYLQKSDQTFIFEPQIIANNLFLITASGKLQKYQINKNNSNLSFQLLWQKAVLNNDIINNQYRLLKLSSCQEMLIVIDGSNKIKAFSADSGNLIWQKELSAILSSAPVCSDEAVFVSSNNNKTFALQKNNGNINWVHHGLIANAAIFNSPNLVLWQDNLLVGYASGDIYLLNQKTGDSLWQNNTNLYQNTFHQDYLNDINANFVIIDNVAFAIGNGGLLKSLNLNNGSLLWQITESGLANFWLAFDNLFFINNQNKLTALNKDTGKIKWQVQLPYLKNAKKLASKIIYNGLVLAGEKILITSQNGDLIMVSAYTGEIETTINLGAKIFHQPLVLDDKIYLHLLHKFTSQLIVLQ